MRPLQLATAGWPAERLSDALTELARRSGLMAGRKDGAHTSSACFNQDEIGAWIPQAAKRLGCEAESLETTLGELPNELSSVAPALIALPDSSFLAVLKSSRKSLTVLTSDLERKRISLAAVCAGLCSSAGGAYQEELQHLVQEAGICSRQRPKALQFLLAGQLSRLRFNQCWLLRSQPGGNTLQLLRQVGALQNGVGMILAHTVQYLLWLASWSILGTLSFEGRMDRAWLMAWALLLLTIVPCQVITTWLQGLFGIGLGGFLKRRLLCGAMKLAPDEMRQHGVGSFLGQALEAEALEALALTGGMAGLLAIVEIGLAMLFLGRFALVLVFCCLLAAAGAWRFLSRFERWTDTRMDMTEDLVEAMVGHRTRLAQLKRNEWHQDEDQSLHRYFQVSRLLDSTGGWLIAALPRGWLLVGLAGLAPSIAAGHTNGSSTATMLGGILLAYTGLRRLSGCFADGAAARVAWKKIAPLFHAASRPEILGDTLMDGAVHSAEKLLEADRLSYRYRRVGKPALESCSLTIRPGERVLLEGPSGGGKTTFASLLSGVRQPESGLLLIKGIDRQTMGEERWRKRIAAAPQFHENHILTETLAFNLLMGRGWPAPVTDMQEAETVCRELGLGSLLDTMPAGLLQMVGEGGWQLSHGERSRIFIARALLQSADLVILDESFAALDPENARLALESTIARAKTLMVIAHP